MNHSTDILVDNQVTIEQIIKLINKTFNLKFKENKTDEDVVYYAYHDNEYITVYGDLEFENDCGIQFTDYEYIIGFNSRKRSGNEVKITRDRHKKAHEIATLLSESYQCNIVIVEDLQITLRINEIIINHDIKSLSI